MRYFQTLPKIRVTKDGYSYMLTDLTTRANIKSDLLSNPMLYYDYSIKDDDTPEIIAHKYYGDSYRYWIIMLANEITDPAWDWPLTNEQLYEHYLSVYPSGGIHHYEKIVEKYEYNTQTIVTETFVIDSVEYNTLNSIGTESKEYTLPTGTVKVTTSVREVSNYDYLLEQNEKKRNIRILNKDYVSQIENEFRKLMV